MGDIWKVVKKEVKIDDTKLNLEDLDSPCRELFNGGLGVVVSLPVCWHFFVGSHWAFNPAVAHSWELYRSAVLL